MTVTTATTEDGTTTTTTDTLYFAYDAAGTPQTVTHNGTTYYYSTNLQGDVVSILNASGTAVVSYTYDAWGKLLTTTGSMASDLGTYNPLRYRAYVYDAETESYYLQSRYYTPETGRFVNADGYASTGQGVLGNNMFTYCNNDPVMYTDPTGEIPWLIIAIVAVCAIGGGIMGGLYEGELEPTESQPDDYTPPSVWPKKDTNPNTQTEPDESQQEERKELTTGDRVKNIFIGIGLGAAVGGLAVAMVGAMGSVAAGSASTYIAAFGGTGLQTFATGAAVYDIFAVIFSSLFGVEMEPIEIEP